MPEADRHTCYPCVAAFAVTTDPGRPDLVVRHCPFCGGPVVSPERPTGGPPEPIKET